MKKLSSGQDSTLGWYRDMCIAFFGFDSPATAFIDKKIREDPDGENGEVVADETQMTWLLFDLASGKVKDE